MARSPTDAFMSKVDKSGDCWKWLGAKNKKGYGVIRYQGMNYLAHRVMFEMENGPIPDEMLLCHKCDTPDCVNPSHIFVGTAQDNMVDMVKKGRHAFQKLSEDDVREIRMLHKMGAATRDLAKEYGVTLQNIQFITSGKSWKHVA